jgi:plastocyanin
VGAGAVRVAVGCALPLVLTACGQPDPARNNSRRFTIGRPGDYRFLCTIHEAKGQVERLVVTSK